MLTVAAETDASTERLEAEICTLAANIAAAEARLLSLIAEYDRRQGWAAWGCRSCAHWLAWKCGIGKHAAREKIRVGHALTELPLTRAAFERGELSFSQVRAITRIATPHNEPWLVNIARSATAQQLERLVAATASSQKIRDDGFAAAQCELRQFHDGLDYDMGMFTAGMQLLGDEGRLLMKALKAAAKQLRDERGPLGPEQTNEQLLADAVVLLAESFLAHGPAARTGTDDYRVVIFADESLIDHACESCDHCDDTPVDDNMNPVPRDAARCHVEQGPIITQATLERIWCDSAATRVVVRDGTLQVETDHEATITGSIRRALRLRDKHCRFPGCSSTRADAHHIRWRSRKGPTILHNLVLLCRFHHRLIHEYGYHVKRTRDGDIRFYDPKGRQLHNRPVQPISGNIDDLLTDNAARGLHIGPETATPPYWHGDKVDLELAVWSLLQHDGTDPHIPSFLDERPRGDATTLAVPNGPSLN
jgi:hypothetical protein